MKFFLLVIGFYLFTANCLDLKDVVIIILSQSNNYHEGLAEDLKNNIFEQAQQLKQESPVVHLTHIDFPHVGGWAILPLIPYIRSLHHGNCSWFFFMEDKTRIRLKKLLGVLDKYNYNEEVWLGHAINDREATIIHHFAFFENPEKFKFPNAGSGIVISSALINSLEHRWKARETSKSDFTIDYSHELALFIWNNDKGPELTHEPLFCIDETRNCATFSTHFQPCEIAVPKHSLYFAVKTCEKFHKDRVTVVQKTWGKHAKIIKYFSDVIDKSIPTISLGIPNTEQGHCGKTLAILKYIVKEISNQPDVKWILLADDDTIFSVAHLQEFLSCYDDSKPVVLGERYGFNVYNEDGYNYVTGGGGIVFSRSLIEKIVNSRLCECPSISSPDDMFLGVCFRRLGSDVTHSSLFHQARPMDYPPEYLKDKHMISFHKHWMIDPILVYNEWFGKADTTTTSKHNEL